MKYMVIEIFTCMARLLDPNHLKVVVALAVESIWTNGLSAELKSHMTQKHSVGSRKWFSFETGKS